MSDELPKENRPSKTLDERFANRPHTMSFQPCFERGADRNDARLTRFGLSPLDPCKNHPPA
jgi:hypothetical protein